MKRLSSIFCILALGVATVPANAEDAGLDFTMTHLGGDEPVLQLTDEPLVDIRTVPAPAPAASEPVQAQSARDAILELHRQDVEDWNRAQARREWRRDQQWLIEEQRRLMDQQHQQRPRVIHSYGHRDRYGDEYRVYIPE